MSFFKHNKNSAPRQVETKEQLAQAALVKQLISRVGSLVEELGYHGFDDANKVLRYRPYTYAYGPQIEDREHQPARRYELSGKIKELQNKIQALCEYLGVELKTFDELHPRPEPTENPYSVVKKGKKKALP